MRPRLLLCALALVGAACAGAGPSHGGIVSWTSFVRVATTGQWRGAGTDTFEVWVCHVPADTTAPLYGGLPLRRDLTPERVTSLVARRVPLYFSTISHGAYRPVFVAGGEVTMAKDDGPQACIDKAVARAEDTTRAILAVADAEHAPGQQGGFGDGGTITPEPSPVRVTRRYAYVGASDFSPDWGDDPPMDLVEHEIGHTLGWVHSGVEPGSPEQYGSALDVMSDSAAPRAADPAARDAPDTLAVNRVIAGWMPSADVAVRPGGGEARLSAGAGASGLRLLVLPVDASSFLTVELVTSDGYDSHLPHGGVAVHRVSVRGGVLQPIEALNGKPPHTALLRPGESLDIDGWRIVAGAGGTVTAAGTKS